MFSSTFVCSGVCGYVIILIILMVDHHAKNAENHYYPCRIVCTSSKETHPRSVGLFLDVRQPSTLKGLDTEKWEKRRK